MRKSVRFAIFLRLTTLSIVVFILIWSIFASMFMDRTIRGLSSERLNLKADDLSHHINMRMENHSYALYGSRAFILNAGNVTQEQWDGFFRDQQTLERFPSISTISYLRFFDHSEREEVLRQMRAQPQFGPGLSIHPEGKRDKYALAQLTVSNNDVRGGFGTDVYAGKNQKQAMDRAAQTGKPTATPPYMLATGFEGFAVFLPVYSGSAVDGFTLLSFRSDDFIKALFEEETPDIRYRITDVTDPASKKVLHQTANWRNKDQLERTDNLDILGRQWQITYAADTDYAVSRITYIIPPLVIAVGILISTPLLIAFRVSGRPEGKL